MLLFVKFMNDAIRSHPRRTASLSVKRSIDIGLSLGMLALLPLPVLAISLLIKVTSRGAVLFRQERVGQNGRPFVMYKFRSMREDAQFRQDASRSDVVGPAFKLRHDPRVTPIGRWLRISSIDELPQLWNVLKGDMSLVGPRPALTKEAARYRTWQKRRLTVKPGMTGPWQVSGRSNVGFDQWIEMDLDYIDNWSLKLDVILLLRTIPAVLSGRGAW